MKNKIFEPADFICMCKNRRLIVITHPSEGEIQTCGDCGKEIYD